MFLYLLGSAVFFYYFQFLIVLHLSRIKPRLNCTEIMLSARVALKKQGVVRQGVIRHLATGVSSTMTRDSKVHQNLLEDHSFINYKQNIEYVNIVRERLGRPLTYAEKILYGHLDDPHGQEIERGVSYLKLRPDRVACQDATCLLYTSRCV